MASKSRVVLVVLALVGGASLTLPLPTSNPQVRLRFTGICDFIPEPNGNLRVLMPDASSDLMKDQMPHRAFIRALKSSVRGKSASPFCTEGVRGKSAPRDCMENNTYGALLLHDETISLAGPFETAPLQTAASYSQLVPDLLSQEGVVLASSLPPIAARMLLDRGRLSAMPPTGNPSRVLSPVDATPTPEECKRAHPLASIVELTLPLRREASGKSFAITTTGTNGTRTLTFDYDQSSDIEILIGNVPENQILDRPPETKPHRQDMDFLFHYRLAGGTTNRAAKLVPTSCALPITIWEPCYVARWGTTVK
jgi:hypothetical protein